MLLLLLSWPEIVQNPTLLSIGLGFTLFLAAFILALPILYLLQRYAHILRLLDYPGEIKIHHKAMPIGGGVGIFASTVLSLGIGALVIYCYSASLERWLEFINWNPQLFYNLLAILIGGSIIFITGLIDDYCDLRPWTKLLIEVAVASGLFVFDIRATLFIENALLSYLMTVGWVVLITNSFNLLDNMDGLSGGVALISGMIFVWASVTVGQWTIVFMLLALLGGILGFLRYNFAPATIFMGDSGSLFIGYMMGTLTIYAHYYKTPYPLFAVAMPLLVLAVPLFDTLTVVSYRWREKRPIFKGDKNHFSHRLVALGMPPRRAVLIIYLITFATGITAILLYQVNWLGAIIILIQLACTLLAIHLLEHNAAGKSKQCPNK